MANPPTKKVIDMQLQAANLVYIFDVIILSVTANKSGRLTVETSFLPFILKHLECLVFRAEGVNKCV